jgi:hypothetical protein
VRLRELHWTLGKVPGWLGGWENKRHGSSTLMAAMVPAAALWWSRARGRVPTFYSRLVLAKAVRARQSTGTSRYGRWPPATSASCTAATALDGRSGRRGLAIARVARDARGVGEGGGATHGRSTAHGPAGQSRPRRAVRRRTGGLRGARIATLFASARALALGAPAQISLRPVQLRISLNF